MDRTKYRVNRKRPWAGSWPWWPQSPPSPASGQAAGEQIIANGDFESGSADWSAYQFVTTIGAPGQSGAAAHLQNAGDDIRGQLYQDQ